jgi:hypothetical protein
MPTTHKAPAYRKAYSYVKHGKIVHVAAKGVPPAQEQLKGRAKKVPLTPQEWGRKLQANLQDWNEAFGKGREYEYFHLEDVQSEDEAKDWLKHNTSRLRKDGHYILDLNGKVLPPTGGVKKSRKPVYYPSLAANTQAVRQYAAKTLGIPVEESAMLKHRSALDAEAKRIGLTPVPNLVDLELQAYQDLGMKDGAKTDAEGAVVVRYCSKVLQKWYLKNKAKALRLGIPIVDGYGNALLLPPAQLPPAPWTVYNARKKMAQGAELLGFNASYALYQVESPWRKDGGIETGQATLKALQGLALVLDIAPAVRQGVHIEVSGIGSPSTNAVYYSDIKRIDVDPKHGKHSVYHEFGHYLDHFIGDFDKRSGFASETPPGDDPQRQAVHAFIDAAKVSQSYVTWDTEDKHHQKDYWHQPSEMVARFFDQWCSVRLQEKGVNPSDYFSDPHYTKTKGRFSDSDFAALRPLFAAAMGAHLRKAFQAFSSSKSSSTSKSCRRSHAEGPRPSPVISGQISSSIGRGSSRGRPMAVISPGGRRSVKSDLVKARTVGAKNKGPRQGRYGVLTSTDPSFYPGKGGMRYLSAAEAGRAGDIVARYARRGVAVNFVPSVHGQDHAATKPSPEEQMADETVAAVDALRARIARKPVDTTKLAALPNIGVDPLQQPMIYLLSLGRGAAYEEMKGPAPLTAQESKALLAEFEPILKQTVDALSRRFRLPPADRAELRSDASLFLLESARTYDARSRGVPAEGNNFLALMLASMPKRLRGKVLENRRQPTGQTPYTESDSDDVLATAARAARIETPEQRLRRQQLAQSVRQSFFNVLSPVEYAVVISRLNILDQQTQGTVAGLKPWKQVREDVLLHATALADTPRDAEKLAGHLQKVRAANYRVIFDRAMEKLRSPTGLTGQARQNLAELADLHRLYLEGVRHESFGSDAFGRLQLGEALATLGPEQKAQKSLMSLPLEQRRRAILEAWPLLAKAFGSSQRCYELCKALLEQSTDALRHRLSAPVPVDVRPPDYQEAVVWALKRGIHRSLCVVPPYQNAWAGLLDECAIWQLNGR